jgi:hypothetical protein
MVGTKFTEYLGPMSAGSAGCTRTNIGDIEPAELSVQSVKNACALMAQQSGVRNLLFVRFLNLSVR